MFSRVKQVISALTASINRHEEEFANRYLRPGEQELFWGMSMAEQRHALNVTYTALSFSGRLAIDIHRLIRCALLHDVGKRRGDINTAGKIMAVLAHACAPAWAEAWGRQGRGTFPANLRHAFYIYFNHAERGAALLSQVGTEPEIIEIIRRHHKAPAKDDPPELCLLRKADNMN
ncbi:HDIG domain-containing metalloprotein [Propionispora vibrioides]|uniref:HDIG domain-containing protein n=1 Tax=Propionispora vibrioides TaxID=112903 RepID=A0A1H8T9B8_9FIRM|nr:HDIG domain-containing metalloprotein [Propionispora vibrioides]SEO87650.1 HDIG domain-containing protein [Propionispora vibrioides]